MLPWWKTLSTMQQDIKYVCLMHPGIWVGLHFVLFMVKWQNFPVWVLGSFSLSINIHQQYFVSKKFYQVFCYRFHIADNKCRDHWRLSVNGNNMFTFSTFLRLSSCKKVLQTHPKICCTIIYFPLVSSALRIAYSFINFHNLISE